MRIVLPTDYPYLYEAHLHTNQGSACGRNTGAEMAAACRAFGYTGIFVTDHNWGGNTCVSRELPWEEWMMRYATGYRDAKAYGDVHDFDVFFGMETGFNGTEFLIYGLTPEWFIDHEAIRTADIRAQYELVHEGGGIVSQAHPYRVEPYIPEIRLFPEYVDAIEAFNAMHSSPLCDRRINPVWNDQALALARASGRPITAGSDVHRADIVGGGMAFTHRLASAAEFCSTVLSGTGYIVSDGAYWRDSNGEVIGAVEFVD
ncbi:hypothetical protein SAMN02910456_01951 [Ruminococcaceae bacterium YRB3002]|nr:hypothetical protein SAMN02910456_01951 [Ruminococcaceae bacterium YRB3002]